MLGVIAEGVRPSTEVPQQIASPRFRAEELPLRSPVRKTGVSSVVLPESSVTPRWNPEVKSTLNRLNFLGKQFMI